MSEADLEYGPTPETAEHEHTDIEPAIATTFAIWLAISLVISGAIVYGTFWLFEGREQVQGPQRFPLAAGRVLEPPGPRLQTQPFKDVYLLREGERDRLFSYGWVDQGAGVVRIPIEEAMRIVSERGGIASTGQPPSAIDQVVQDSSSGRTTAQR